MTKEMDLGGDLGLAMFRPPHSLTAINDACSEYMQFIGEDQNKAKLNGSWIACSPRYFTSRHSPILPLSCCVMWLW